MKSTRTNARARCPTCAADLSGATSTEGDNTPSAGDLSVCAYCAALLVFRADLTLREIDLDELAALDDEELTKLGRAQAMVRYLCALRGAH